MDKIWIYVWKQRKLGEIVNRITRKNSKLISELPLTISAQQGLIDQNEFFDKRVASKDVSGYYLIKNGEFAYNRSTSNDAPWGAIKRLDRYENGVLSTLYIVFEIKDETLVNSDFLVAYYNTNLWHKGIHEIAAEGARNHGLLNIAPTDFFKTKLKLPADIEEQQEIGEYFKKIDSLITFHHRKLNILNKICRYAWEQRKVLDLLIQPITDGPHETPKLVEKGVHFISVDAIVDNKIDFNRKRGNISEEYDELCCKKYKPQFHDVYLVKSGSTVGKVAIVETTDRFNIWSPLAAMRCGEKTYPYFLYDLLQTKDLQAQVADKASNGTQPNLSMRELEKFPVSVPSNLEEQKKIGDYFRSLDHLITLHQRKCDETKKLKKCMLQKMFPKEGEKVPEIRFSGFTGDWKQRKLGEIVNRITRKNSKLISELPLTISAQQGLIDQNEFFDKRVASKDVSGYYLIKNGEFAYNRSTSNDAPWGAIKRLDRYENGVLSTLYIVFEIKDETLVNSDFLVAYYNTNLWHKGIHEIAAEGARNHGLLNIAPTDFFKTKLKLPADIEEQQEIGEYFKKIDSLITFHHRKLNILNKICRYAWEQRKVLDLLIQPITDGPHETPKLVEKGVHFISVDAIVDNKIDFNRKRGNISEEYDELCCKKYKPQFHDVYLVKSGSTVGKVAIVETTDRFNIWSPLAAMRCGEKTYPYFLYDLLQTKDLQAQVADKASNGTQPNLSMRELEKFPVSVPSNLEEQKKIGDYFRSLDHLITLHQQKCKQLQIIRKFMLKNMFL